jgi:uncharacterized Zn finger protein
MNKQVNITELLSGLIIEELALPSNIRYGQAIYDRGGVEIIERLPDSVEAWVGGLDGTVNDGGSQRRRTKFFINDGELAWDCKGNPKNHQVFCKHCVALSLKMLEE